MKKAWVHILFITILLDYTSLGQMLKLPVLVVHFLEHRQLDHHISFVDFLSMHYGGDDLNDSDDDRDGQLPYKSIDSHSVHQLASPIAKTNLQKHPTAYIHTVGPASFKDDHLPHPALDSLFRPPRA